MRSSASAHAKNECITEITFERVAALRSAQRFKNRRRSHRGQGVEGDLGILLRQLREDPPVGIDRARCCVALNAAPVQIRVDCPFDSHDVECTYDRKTVSSATNRPTDTLAVRVDVVEWDVNPLRQIRRLLLVTAECAHFASEEESVNRLSLYPEECRCASRRHQTPAVLIEQSDEPRISAFAACVSHRHTIVAYGLAYSSTLLRTPRAWT